MILSIIMLITSVISMLYSITPQFQPYCFIVAIAMLLISIIQTTLLVSDSNIEFISKQRGFMKIILALRVIFGDKQTKVQSVIATENLNKETKSNVAPSYIVTGSFLFTFLIIGLVIFSEPVSMVYLISMCIFTVSCAILFLLLLIEEWVYSKANNALDNFKGTAILMILIVLFGVGLSVYTYNKDFASKEPIKVAIFDLDKINQTTEKLKKISDK